MTDNGSKSIGWPERIAGYVAATSFPNCLSVGGDGRVAGMWIMGNDYRVASSYYGGYPAGYLRRVKALFPEKRRPLMVLPEMASHRRKSKKHGHAAPIGSGPNGETCGSCEHLIYKQMGKRYYKCMLARARWTGGTATDVGVKDEACRLWEAKR